MMTYLILAKLLSLLLGRSNTACVGDVGYIVSKVDAPINNHDYGWKMLDSVWNAHNWFRGKDRRGNYGIAVSYAGKNPDQTDHGVVWLNHSQTVDIETGLTLAEARLEKYLGCEVMCELLGRTETGVQTSISGTNIHEVLYLLNKHWVGVRLTAADGVEYIKPF